jgi:hypothetical protein
VATRKWRVLEKSVCLFLNHLARLLVRKKFEKIHNFYFRILQVPTSTVFVLLGIYYWMLCRLCCFRFPRHNLKFCAPSSCVSTVIANKPKNKQNLYHTAMFLFYILQKIHIIGASETSVMSSMPHIMGNVLSIIRASFGRACILSSEHEINLLVSSSVCSLFFQIFSF